MDIASSAVGFPSYPSTLDDGRCEAGLGQGLQSGLEVSYTQPVASRPLDQQCGDADGDESALGAPGQSVDNNFSWFGDSGDDGSARTL
jgi:hypothetical protein